MDPRAPFVDILHLYQRALELDPQFADALAGLARVAFDIWQNDGAEALPPTTARKLAYESASEVISLEPDNADAFGVLALLQVTQGELEIAETSARKAVALTPNRTQSHLDLGIVLSVAGRHGEALVEMETAFKLDPEPTAEFHGEFGRVLFFDGQYQRAIEHLEKPLGLSPRYDTALAGAYAELGRTEKAEAVLSGPGRWRQFANQAYFRTMWSHYQAEDLDHILSALDKAGLPAWPQGYQPAVDSRLDTVELEAIGAGKTWVGHSTVGGDFVRQFTNDGRVALRNQTTMLSGTVQIREGQLCIQIPSALLDRDDCGYVYRHDSGSAQEKNEYVHVTIGDVYFFSVSP
jgi:adenylate cyclase